jgi:hypothetical protein
MYFDHRRSVMLAIREKLGPEVDRFASDRDSAGCKLEECTRRRRAIGDAVKIIITEAGTKGRSNSFD